MEERNEVILNRARDLCEVWGVRGRTYAEALEEIRDSLDSSDWWSSLSDPVKISVVLPQLRKAYDLGAHMRAKAPDLPIDIAI